MNLPPCLFQHRDAFEAACRAAYQAAYLGNDTLLCRVLTRYLMFADGTDIGFTPHVCLDGFWESWITLRVARTLRPGSFCIDIGANHGYYALLLAEAARDGGRMLACEPNPRLIDLLENTLEVNGLHGWSQVVPKAVTGTTGDTVSLIVPPRRCANASLYRPATAADDVVPVATIRVDDLVSAWPRVDFIKIDAEGSEEAIWQGMQDTLRHSPELAVVMEVRADRYADAREFFGQIEVGGFPLRAIDYASEVVAISQAEMLARPAEDFMLFLQRT